MKNIIQQNYGLILVIIALIALLFVVPFVCRVENANDIKRQRITFKEWLQKWFGYWVVGYKINEASEWQYKKVWNRFRAGLFLNSLNISYGWWHITSYKNAKHLLQTSKLK